MTVFSIAVAGAVGCVLRYGVGVFCQRHFGDGFPWATLAVNVIGAFVMGLLAAYFVLSQGVSPRVRLAIMTGLLGGFTTYSAYALDAITLWERKQLGTAVVYVTATTTLALVACFAGVVLGRLLERG